MELWLPPSMTRPQFVGSCAICGSDFTSRPKYERHMAQCADHYAQELVELRAEQRKWDADPDPEWAAYNRQLAADGVDVMSQYARGRRTNIRRASES